jgi:hypothetical protein
MENKARSVVFVGLLLLILTGAYVFSDYRFREYRALLEVIALVATISVFIWFVSVKGNDDD